MLSSCIPLVSIHSAVCLISMSQSIGIVLYAKLQLSLQLTIKATVDRDPLIDELIVIAPSRRNHDRPYLGVRQRGSWSHTIDDLKHSQPYKMSLKFSTSSSQVT